MPVFHPGHDSYHGFTMLLLSDGPRTYVGRWDAVDGEVVWLNDACIHTEGDEGMTKAAFLERLALLGPTSMVGRIAVPLSEVTSAHQLGEWKRARRT